MFPRRKQRAKNGLIGADQPTDSGVTIVTMLPELLAPPCPGGQQLVLWLESHHPRAHISGYSRSNHAKTGFWLMKQTKG